MDNELRNILFDSVNLTEEERSSLDVPDVPVIASGPIPGDAMNSNMSTVSGHHHAEYPTTWPQASAPTAPQPTDMWLRSGAWTPGAAALPEQLCVWDGKQWLRIPFVPDDTDGDGTYDTVALAPWLRGELTLQRIGGTTMFAPVPIATWSTNATFTVGSWSVITIPLPAETFARVPHVVTGNADHTKKAGFTLSRVKAENTTTNVSFVVLDADGVGYAPGTQVMVDLIARGPNYLHFLWLDAMQTSGRLGASTVTSQKNAVAAGYST